MKKNGFTLIEILVVVAIIGLLATLGIVSFQASMRRSRDATRIAEIKAMQNAAEQFYADQSPNAYPTNNDCSNLDDYVQGFDDGYVGPRGDTYVCAFSGTTYCLSANLEGTDGNCEEPCSTGGSDPASEPGGHFCVQNLF